MAMIDAIINNFGACLDHLRRMLADVDDERLIAPLPDPDPSGLFLNLGPVLIYALVSHTALHVGQLTAWRRAMALPLIYDPSVAEQGE